MYGYKRRGEDAYYDNAVKRVTWDGSEMNIKDINLVIVVDWLLTGYDSKFINALYVARTLVLQGLIQTYSEQTEFTKKNLVRL